MANEIMNTNDAFICTVDSTNKQNAFIIFNAISAAKSLASIGDNIFTVTDIITRPSTRAITNEPCTAVYFICDDGQIYFSQSEGICRSVNTLVEMMDKADIDIHDGIAMQVISSKTNNGNTIKSIRVMPKK